MGKMPESVGKMLKMLIKMLKKFRLFSIFETPLFSTAPAPKMGQDAKDAKDFWLTGGSAVK